MNAHDATLTLCVALAAGVFLIALAERLRMPSIALLLVGGVVLGPEVLGLVNPATLGRGLETVVTLAVAVILFEGGLTLDVSGFRREPKVIVRMLTLGVLVTWTGAAAAVYLVFGNLGIELAIIAGSLVIVTGPTVVSPILRRIGIRPRLHHILYWEGVLVDAVGVFVAVLCYEWIESSSDSPAFAPLGRFFLRFAVGVGIGAATGLILGLALRRRLIPSKHTNIVVLGAALLALAASNAVLHESGILAAIVAGFLLNVMRTPQVKQLKRFELELTELGIGLLFVLLAAKLELANFLAAGPQLVIVLMLILLVLRPVNIIISTLGQNFDWREKVFLSWLAPRGIVAASMASLFSLRLSALGHEGAVLLETVTYAVIGTTVVLQGFSAPLVARILGLKRESRGLWLLIGDPSTAMVLHQKMRQAGGRSIVIPAGRRRNMTSDPGGSASTIFSDPLDPAGVRDPRVAEVEAVLACARDSDLNAEICAAWSSVVGASSCYRWASEDNEEDAGVPLFTDVPAPAELIKGVETGAYSVEALEVGPREDAARFGPHLRPIFSFEDGHMVAVTGTLSDDVEKVVAFVRRVPGLYGLVQDSTILDTHAATFEEVVHGLLKQVARRMPSFAVEIHLAEILQREKTMSTAIGNGVAVPHVYDKCCERSTCYVANVTRGLELDGPDGEPVKLVFLIVSPPGKAQEHLQSLAAVAQLATDLELLDVLVRQRTRGRLLALMRERA